MTRNDRRRILAQWRRSGLSAAGFAPSAGVSLWTLYSWRRQERPTELDEISSSPPAFVELVADASPSSPVPDPSLTVELPRGITLRTGRDVDPASLRRLVDALL